MKTLLPLVIFIAGWGCCAGQLCPGGGSNFLTAIPFDPAWIYGCNTGTSCNGGVAFDNRPACIPIPALEACAPPPSCGMPSNNASNVWFTFYASSPTATISCFQNTSLVLAIQAFSGNLSCGSLTQLGCAISSGPSSGVQLQLSGLLPGTLYYFRIFGSSNPVSQRTGLYCFCGSTGLGIFSILSADDVNLRGKSLSDGISLSWNTRGVDELKSVDIEKSTDGTNFLRLESIDATASKNDYHYGDKSTIPGVNYYRLKLMHADGHFSYTSAINIHWKQFGNFRIMGNPANSSLQVMVNTPTAFLLLDIAGHVLKSVQVAAGMQSIPLEKYSNGLYCLQPASGGPAQKFYLAR